MSTVSRYKSLLTETEGQLFHLVRDETRETKASSSFKDQFIKVSEQPFDMGKWRSLISSESGKASSAYPMWRNKA